MKDHIDVKIKSWGNGSASGPWIKLDLFSEDDLEALKNHVGKGFHMILVPEQVDEGEPEPIEEEPKPFTPNTLPEHKRKEFKIKGPKPELSEANKCAIMLYQPNFWDFVNDQYRPFENDEIKNVGNALEADKWLKQFLGIGSKTALNDESDLNLLTVYRDMIDNFRRWVNREAA